MRISEVGDGFYVTPVPEPTEAELDLVLATIDQGRRSRVITAADEARIDREIKRHRAERKRKCA